ncbi:AAA family ATPase [Nitratidesulfovibrio sp. SRB-5]|uniref:AAA family ATPase n=1 Tax=Nitratidesulfovibrio sp. SRB-5 TaxID=2872636 RepID=UPI0010276195|nr:AAA family ATPase [Nitratidesulfovibrio sp. SRB-5]MBZ2172164.1 AAA family ATPase [Nitratidesulfovibrio sp. SRB-5]RXF77358.1 hypothetical protein EKK70_06830 [Desulfovibrio sp. DS-1]
MADMKNKITKIHEINIQKFRGLIDVNVKFADRITVICGKNGTSKSTILGLIAQTFSFRTDYTQHPPDSSLKDYRTISGAQFESKFSEHFRFSKTFDKAKDMDVAIKIYDGAEDTKLTDLKLTLVGSKDRTFPRPVLRNNSTKYTDNASRNVTHPLIYLSIKRLLPISERDKYTPITRDAISSLQGKMLSDLNRLLLKSNCCELTATEGTLPSIVGHASHYDHESVSVGDDNAGQIIQSLYSFKILKETYKNYHGGILLIDEADAALFPAAQIELINLLTRFSKECDLQIIITSHSPTLIERVKWLSDKSKSDYSVVYISSHREKMEIHENYSWAEILADLKVEPLRLGLAIPKINIYFEDGEAKHFFKRIVGSKIKRRLKISKANLGCENYKNLIKEKIEEFSKNSIICFDQDVKSVPKIPTAVKLPGAIPPDQLLFELLSNFSRDHAIWENELRITKDVFYRIAREIRQLLNINSEAPINLSQMLPGIKAEGGIIRSTFKNFYKDQTIQALADKAFDIWKKDNSALCLDFEKNLIKAISAAEKQIHTIAARAIL